jgi:hypothetical protein
VGAVVQLPHNWILEGSFTYGESDATQIDYHSINLLAMRAALNGTLPGHVGHFFNPFLDNRVSGNFNQEFYSAISTDQHLDSRTDLVQWQLKAGGTLIDLCTGPLSVSGGLEYRSESLIEANDRLSELRLIALGNFLVISVSGPFGSTALSLPQSWGLNLGLLLGAGRLKWSNSRLELANFRTQTERCPHRL